MGLVFGHNSGRVLHQGLSAEEGHLGRRWVIGRASPVPEADRLTVAFGRTLGDRAPALLSRLDIAFIRFFFF